MKKFLKLFVMGFVISSLALLVACGGGGANEKAEPAKQEEPAKDKKKLVVGTDAAYPPFEKQEAGKITGFDIDIINAIAEEMGWELEIKHTGWDPLFEGIDNGTVDLGISAITINDERKQTKDFSEPYFEAYQLIMTKDPSINSLADLEGKKIGVQSATTGELVVQEKFGKTYEGIKGYDDTPAAVDDLMQGRVEAVVADNAVLKLYLEQVGAQGYKLIRDPSFTPEYYGIMVKKGNTELLAQINEGLKKIKENGKYDEIYKKYEKYFTAE